MNFTQAIASGFSNYVKFSGRAARSEFWYWVLFYMIAAVLTKLVDYTIGVPLTLPLLVLILFLPSLAVGARRLHDIDRTAWWLLLHLVPIVGPIVLIIWDCQKGTSGPNRFGPDPLPSH
jgi:uncharacterized membrane protein YhaH (DUF805 family)